MRIKFTYFRLGGGCSAHTPIYRYAYMHALEKTGFAPWPGTVLFVKTVFLAVRQR